MKTLISLFFLLMISTVPNRGHAANSEEEDLTPAKVLSEAMAAKTDEEISFLAKRILEKQNIELLKAGFNAPEPSHLPGTLYKELRNLPDSPFLDEAVLLIMRKPWFYDDDSESSRPQPLVQNFCIRVIRTRLKGESLELDDQNSLYLFDSLASRQQLADKFEAAIRPPQVLISPKVETTAPQNQSNVPIAPPSMLPVENSASLAVSSESSDIPKIWWAAIIAVVLGVLWWALRKRHAP